MANLRHQLSIKKYLDSSIENIYACFFMSEGCLRYVFFMQETELSLYCKVLWWSTAQGRGAAESSSGDGALQRELDEAHFPA